MSISRANGLISKSVRFVTAAQCRNHSIFV